MDKLENELDNNREDNLEDILENCLDNGNESDLKRKVESEWKMWGTLLLFSKINHYYLLFIIKKFKKSMFKNKITYIMALKKNTLYRHFKIWLTEDDLQIEIFVWYFKRYGNYWEYLGYWFTLYECYLFK